MVISVLEYCVVKGVMCNFLIIMTFLVVYLSRSDYVSVFIDLITLINLILSY